MATSELLWHLRSAVGSHALCHLAQTRDGYFLRVERDNQAIVSEHHKHPDTAVDKANTLYEQLAAQGWAPVRDRF